jgi:hypothetical protein
MSKTRLISFLRGFAATGMIIGVLSIMAPRKAYGLFGEEIPVLLEQLAMMTNIYRNSVQAYQNSQNLYNNAKMMAQRFTQKNTWLTIGQRNVDDYTRNKYGETVNWSAMMNGRPNLASSAWTSATLPIQADPYLAQQTLGSSAALASLASAEAVDGSATRCLETITQYRANLQSNQQRINALRAAQLDGTDATNSEVQQLNLINAANAQSANEQQAQGAIHACEVEQSVLDNKIKRDEIAAHLNAQAQLSKSLQSIADQSASQSYTEPSSFKIP